MVGLELMAYITAKESGQPVVSVDTKTEEQPPSSMETGADMDLLRCFKRCFREALGIEASISYGRDRKAIQALLKSGLSPEALEALIPVFFACKNNSYIFRSGSVVSFCGAIAQLQVEHLKLQAQTGPPKWTAQR